MGTGVIAGGKVARVWIWPSTPSSAEVKERVELYLYSPIWAFVACFRVNFYLYLYRYGSTLSLTWGLDGVGSQRRDPASRLSRVLSTHGRTQTTILQIWINPRYSIQNEKSVNIRIHTSHTVSLRLSIQTFTVLTVSIIFKIERIRAGRRMLYNLELSLP